MFQKLTKFIKFKRFCSLNKTKISTKFDRAIKKALSTELIA